MEEVPKAAWPLVVTQECKKLPDAKCILARFLPLAFRTVPALATFGGAG
jgi:hypothetical protein